MMTKSTTLVVLLAAVATLAKASRVGSSRTNDIATISKQNGNRALQELPEEGDLELPDWANDILNGGGGGDVVDWSSEAAWNDWFSSLMGGGSNGTGTGLDICPMLEAAVGMGEAFGIAANCKCNGTITTTMDIGCSVTDCLPGATACGQVAMNMTFGLAAGEVATSVCASFPDMQLKETCFSFEKDMAGGAGSASQTCEAKYNGTACKCSIEDFCLKIDCSSVLPGGIMDTCQMLNMVNVSDVANFLPNFDILDPEFSLDADMIPWEMLDWDNLDFDNFNVSEIEWSSDWASQTWNDLVGGNGGDGEISPGVCRFMSMAVELTEQLGSKGSCTCDDKDALKISCNFTEVCAGIEDGLCGAVQMTLNYDSLSAVDANVCIDYKEDIHPETCFTYKLPIAGQNMEPECTATYGDEGSCKCTINESLCIVVDCSEFEPTAITDTCQFVGLGGQVEAKSLMLDFKAPVVEEAVTDETTDGGTVDVISVEPEQSAEGSSASSFAHLDVAAGVIALFSGVLRFL